MDDDGHGRGFGVKTSSDILVAHLEGEAVLLSLKSKRYYRLNETGAVIWKGLEDGLEPDAIVAQLTNRFDVDPDVARREFDEMVSDLRDMELVED